MPAYVNAKQKKCKNTFVDRMCKNLNREVWQKRNLILKNDNIGHAPFNPAGDRTSINSRIYLK